MGFSPRVPWKERRGRTAWEMCLGTTTPSHARAAALLFPSMCSVAPIPACTHPPPNRRPARVLVRRAPAVHTPGNVAARRCQTAATVATAAAAAVVAAHPSRVRDVLAHPPRIRPCGEDTDGGDERLPIPPFPAHPPALPPPNTDLWSRGLRRLCIPVGRCRASQPPPLCCRTGVAASRQASRRAAAAAPLAVLPHPFISSLDHVRGHHAVCNRPTRGRAVGWIGGWAGGRPTGVAGVDKAGGAGSPRRTAPPHRAARGPSVGCSPWAPTPGLASKAALRQPPVDAESSRGRWPV